MTDDFTGWRKSSHSASGNCVEVGTGPAAVAIRDSKASDGPVLAFAAATWEAFTAIVKAM